MSMLARVAANLFWIGRYIERAENTARLLDMGRRMAALPSTNGNENEWESILASSGSDFLFPESADNNSQSDVVFHLALSKDNPSSIYSCLKAARENMRSTREGISVDSWRAMNDQWLSFKDISSRLITGGSLADTIEQIKYGCMMVVGAFESTLLRDATYDFLKLGTFTERADCTARILDVKYFSLLPPEEAFEGSVDTLQWQTILEATSTRRLFRRLYGTDLRAATVIELLVQNQQCVRSLAFCFHAQRHHIRHVCDMYGVTANADRRANQLFTSVTADDAEKIIQGGLHEYLGECIRANNALADEIARDFHFVPAGMPSPAAIDSHEH